MVVMGQLVNGQFKQTAGNFDVASTPNATTTSKGLMSATDKTKLDKAYTSDDVATGKEIIDEIFS